MSAMCRRERFRFIGREGDHYIWLSERPVDSRYVEIRCGVEWFWNRSSGSGK